MDDGEHGGASGQFPTNIVDWLIEVLRFTSLRVATDDQSIDLDTIAFLKELRGWSQKRPLCPPSACDGDLLVLAVPVV